MSDILPFIVAGIASGAIYGLAASGLVLTYKTSGIFNFGYGALATAAAYVFYWLYVDLELDWKLALAIAVFVVGPLLGLVMERIARKLTHQRTAWKVVGTAGIILVVQGLGTIKYGTDARPVPQFLPKGNDTFRFLDVNIRYSQVTVVVVAIVAVAGLYALFRFTRLGIAMRAVVDDPDLVDLQGTSPVRVRRISWIIGSTFAALSGVLIVPFLGLESITLTFLVVQTFGAAAIGLFSSIPLTFLGGILIGIGESVLTKYEITYPNLLGLSRSLPFLVLIVVMLVTPRQKLLPPTTWEARPSLLWHGPRTMRIGAFIIVFGLLATVPTWAELKLTPYWTGALTTAIIILALGLLVRTAGIVSLCTAAFAGIGAVAFSQFNVDVGIPWIPALLIAGLVAVPVGALVAIPSIRLSGLFLALATLGFGLLIERLFYRRSFMFTERADGREMPRPSLAETDTQVLLRRAGVPRPRRAGDRRDPPRPAGSDPARRRGVAEGRLHARPQHQRHQGDRVLHRRLHHRRRRCALRCDAEPRRSRQRVLLVVQLDHPPLRAGAGAVPGALVRDLRRGHAGHPGLHRR